MYYRNMTICLWLTIIIFLLFGGSFAMYVNSETAIQDAGKNRMDLFLLAEELRQSSDDLTRMVHTYAVTRDIRYREYFQEILDIRNGVKIRPINYSPFYWDIITGGNKYSDQRRLKAAGKTVSLIELIKEEGIPPEELHYLEEVKNKSEILTVLEQNAMALVDKSKAIADKDRINAMGMLHDNEYNEAKAAMMQYLSFFYSMMDNRTLRILKDAEKNAFLMRILFLIMGAVLAFTVFYSSYFMRKLYKEREIQQAFLIQQSKQAELGSMIGAIAHQWKQPLNNISIYAQSLSDAYEHGELTQMTIDQDVTEILNQVDFMDQTIGDFRDFYKPSKDKSSFSPLSEVRKMNQLLTRNLTVNGIHTEIIGDEKIKITGYPGEFRQVILNLLNNARDAFYERKTVNPWIKISINRKDKKYLILITEDNGGGIPDELLPCRIFESFCSTKGNEGTGIGLSMTKLIVEEKFNGKISVHNTEEGCAFEIELPADSTA
jgi:signal transduction histidine kinase